MLKSMFSGVSGLRAHQNKMDVIGNNIANVNTVGFKSGRTTFKDSIYQNLYGSSDGNNVYGGSNPSQIGYGSQVSAISVDFSTGSYEPTGIGTDCMIDGNGFFIVGPKLSEDEMDEGVSNEVDDNQLSQFYLTRVGEFTIDGDGYLVDANKNVVYGFVPDTAAIGTGDITDGMDTIGDGDNTTYSTLKPIRLPVTTDDATELPDITYDDEERLNLSSISIDSNGVISGTAPNGNTYKFGIIAVCNVTNPNALQNTGNSYYKAVSNTGSLQAFQPGEGTTGILRTSCLEMSNVDLATEFSNMITTQRGFQACSKMITVSDEMLEELVNMKR